MSSDKNVVWHHVSVNREMRESMAGHRSAVIWLTGLSGSGKSTIAHALEQRLYDLGCHSFVFDGDNVRHGLCSDLGFSEEDRHENLRRIGEMARLFLEAGTIAITAFISPFAADRQRIRSLIPEGEFLEIYCKCDLEICESRDVKGLYAKARSGEIPQYTGISSPYEAPDRAELVLDTGKNTLDECVDDILQLIEAKGIISRESIQESV